jgi:hypothetical protein
MSFDSIGGLLDHFLDAANYLTGFGPIKGSKALNKKTIDLVSKQLLCDGHSPSKDPYLRLLEMTDFISGMTDSYALSLFRTPAYLGERLLLYHLTGAFFVPIGILFVIRVKVSPGAGGQ